MTSTIHLGLLTCPNDTFAFHGLLTRQVDWRGLEFQVELIDIQQCPSEPHQAPTDFLCLLSLVFLSSDFELFSAFLEKGGKSH